ALVFVGTVPISAGLLSRPHQWAIHPGIFSRDLGDPRYFHRRLHGLCWTALYYLPPAYLVVTAIPPLQRLVFRLFGYRGSQRFTVYPDTWIRDLPLLELGDGVYVSNRATLGTNIVLPNARIRVGRIRLGARTLVGHGAVVGLGTETGTDVEIGVCAAIGMNVRIGEGAMIAPRAMIDHRAVIGRRARIGVGAYVGPGVVVKDNAVLSAGAVLGSRRVVGADKAVPA
ncbi:MAG TPA: DapH/DapD/GlmU-related protein, partial [Thermoanaerobaculia bacterium]|nr:DapH/DapD/GlmU-related protein [Thermoanaerobaculia bacterium]